MSGGKRINLGGYEFVAAEVPPSRKGGGPTSVTVARHALQALDTLKVDSVLVISEVSTSWGSGKNVAAREHCIPVKFVARSTGNNKADIYAFRYDWTEAAA